jgi:hypothetical protein
MDSITLGKHFSAGIETFFRWIATSDISDNQGHAAPQDFMNQKVNNGLLMKGF